MRRNWVILLAAVLVAIGVFLAAFFWPFFFGEPRLRLQYYPAPPWKMKAGDTLQVTLAIPNDGKGAARGVWLFLEVPEGFIGFIAGTSKSEIIVGTIRGGDGRSLDFVISASNGVSPGNYTVRIRLTGENVPEQVFTQLIEVQT